VALLPRLIVVASWGFFSARIVLMTKGLNLNLAKAVIVRRKITKSQKTPLSQLKFWSQN
jgi:hypothetical protein